jgi:hypothetical protein
MGHATSQSELACACEGSHDDSRRSRFNLLPLFDLTGPQFPGEEGIFRAQCYVGVDIRHSKQSVHHFSFSKNSFLGEGHAKGCWGAAPAGNIDVL